MNDVLPESLMTVEWLKERLDDPTLRIVDIRGYVATEDLGGGRQKSTYRGAREEYDAGHVLGSVFVDWTTDITDPDNPVPAQIAPPELFARRMEALGIGDDTAVVVVDHAGGHFATRLWWALLYHGHDAVAVLDGGFAAWQAAGLPLTTDVPEHREVTFTPKVRDDLIADADGVLAQSSASTRQVVDARDAGMFSGATQRGSRGGHIPGAVNLPAGALMRADGRWREGEEIKAAAERAGVSLDTPVTAYCNGGVTATAVLFALHRAGMPLSALANYDGSWNEWGEREDLPVEGNRDLFGA